MEAHLVWLVVAEVVLPLLEEVEGLLFLEY
jgi:hypothetical protein